MVSIAVPPGLIAQQYVLIFPDQGSSLCVFFAPELPGKPSTLLFKVGFPLYIVAREQVGKEFPDMKQNGREIKFTRMGDAVRTAGQLKGEPMLNTGP